MSALINELVDDGIVRSTITGIVEIMPGSEHWILVHQHTGSWVGRDVANSAMSWLDFGAESLDAIAESIVMAAS